MVTAWLTNYKTSLFGIAAAAFNLLANGTGYKEVCVSAALALLGLFAKDHNVTGGTTKV